MALVINKYKIFNPAMAYTGPSSGDPVKIPESIEAGSTFEVIGIDMSGFILRELLSGISIQFNSDVFNQGFYKVGEK